MCCSLPITHMSCHVPFFPCLACNPESQISLPPCCNFRHRPHTTTTTASLVLNTHNTNDDNHNNHNHHHNHNNTNYHHCLLNSYSTDPDPASVSIDPCDNLHTLSPIPGHALSGRSGRRKPHRRRGVHTGTSIICSPWPFTSRCSRCHSHPLTPPIILSQKPSVPFDVPFSYY
ncbi:hypothetical protein F5X96DRAFT_447639 [Biscogniauxia mediterranea]|nr:hypothetical protein F5X96DRAFT_447639 [Biscogniauxia mediterranea]